MADNYLENKMEEHRRSRAVATYRSKRSQNTISFGSYKTDLAQRHVVVDINRQSLCSAVVSRMAAAGCRVAFTTDDIAFGRRLAQSSGSRFYPSYTIDRMIDDVCVHWGSADLLICDKPIQVEHNDGGSRKTIIVSSDNQQNTQSCDITIDCNAELGLSVDNIASLCVYLCCQDSIAINARKILIK